MHHRASLADRLQGWHRRIRTLVRPGAAERETSAELDFHLDMQTQENVRAGMAADEARRAALVAFGCVTRVAEEVRETRVVGWFDKLCALLGTRVLRAELFGVQPTDSATFASAALVLVITAFAASAIPSWRATRVDPLTALRND